jgi:hypothetical protein
LPEFKVKLVDFGPDGKFWERDMLEHEMEHTIASKRFWVSLDFTT